MLMEQIIVAQQQSHEATAALLQTFQPLLRKYAFLLEGGEDSYHELVLFFLELLQKINCETMRNTGDGAVVRYLEKAVRNHYYMLSKKKRKQSDHEIELSDLLYQKLSKEEGDDTILALLAELPPLEQMVIKKIVIQGYSAADIARKQGCTRQHINQAKKRALERLKSTLRLAPL